MTKNEASISIEHLRAILRLDREAGALYWLERSPDSFQNTPARSSMHRASHWNALRAGRQALNSITALGYASGLINGKFFFAHRVVYALIHGHWPTQFIDHINGSRSDNRPGNLRDVSHLENQLNKKLPAINTSGAIGVHWSAPHQKWRAAIKYQGKRKHLGLFDSIDEAVLVRRRAEESLGFHKNHGRKAA